MRMNRSLGLILGLMLASSAPASEVELSYWYMAPEGEGSVGVDGLEGTKVDLEDDLGYGDEEGVFGARVVLGSMHQLEIAYMAFNISAENQIDREVRFGDEVFHAQADVSSELDATFIRGAYRFQAGSDAVQGGFLLGAQYVDLTADASAEGIGDASEDAQVGMPVGGLFLRIQPIPALLLRGSLTGGSWEWDDVSATFIDVEVSAAVFLDPFYAGVGYRNLSIDGEEDTIPLDIDLTFAGPTAFVGLAF